MEKKLTKFKNSNKKIFVSSVRFANVSFSNGSILKYAIDRINKKKFLEYPKLFVDILLHMMRQLVYV